MVLCGVNLPEWRALHHALELVCLPLQPAAIEYTSCPSLLPFQFHWDRQSCRHLFCTCCIPGWVPGSRDEAVSSCRYPCCPQGPHSWMTETARHMLLRASNDHGYDRISCECHPLTLCYSEHGLCTSSIRITWKHGRNAVSLAPHPTSQVSVVRIRSLTRSPRKSTIYIFFKKPQ